MWNFLHTDIKSICYWERLWHPIYWSSRQVFSYFFPYWKLYFAKYQWENFNTDSVGNEGISGIYFPKQNLRMANISSVPVRFASDFTIEEKGFVIHWLCRKAQIREVFYNETRFLYRFYFHGNLNHSSVVSSIWLTYQLGKK